MIHQIINNHRKSNTYVIRINETEVVLIDAGDFDINCFSNWLLRKDFRLGAVILTHEHSDHCIGLKELSKLFDFDLYCSEHCASNIKDPKHNFSKYLEEMDTFSIQKDCNILKDYSSLNLGTKEFKIVETPGHSPGSICILTENFLFTGDTIMNSKTPLGFPHSNRDEYKKSLLKIKQFIKEEVRIYPGHGDPFPYIGLNAI